MSDKYPHLGEQAAAMADADAPQRIRAIQSGVWVPYDRAKAILAHMDELFDHPPIERMPNMLIVGQSNNGKTQILKHFLAKHPPNPNPDGDAAIIPAVFVRAPGTPDIGELCVRILDEVKSPYKETSSPAERIRTVKKVLGRIGTRMLLIDDIQHMLTGGAVKQREFRNGIKDLGNELHISIVAAGIEDAYVVFATDPQLSNRFHPEPLPLWRMDTGMGRLLSSIERKLPLRQPSDLKSAELLQKIAFMSEGTIGEIYDVVKMAAIRAIRDGTERITLELLDGLPWTKPSARKERPALA
ncbi:MAG: TniB family NTP-binding protein [Rhodocyclaceae bacterium]|nr:TniB family NTP-binding protein [Rhodocyclaceae bacterium]